MQKLRNKGNWRKGKIIKQTDRSNGKTTRTVQSEEVGAEGEESTADSQTEAQPSGTEEFCWLEVKLQS